MWTLFRFLLGFSEQLFITSDKFRLEITNLLILISETFCTEILCFPIREITQTINFEKNTTTEKVIL